MNTLSPVIAGNPENRNVGDVFMEFESRLDLCRVDIHPTGNDHVLLAVADVEVTVFVEVSHVADRVVFAAPVRLVLVLGLVVGVEDGPATGEQLSRRVRLLDHVPVFVEEQQLDHGRRFAAGAALRPLVFGRKNRVHPEFGGAIHLPQRVLGEIGEIGLLEGE